MRLLANKQHYTHAGTENNLITSHNSIFIQETIQQQQKSKYKARWASSPMQQSKYIQIHMFQQTMRKTGTINNAHDQLSGRNSPVSKCRVSDQITFR